MYPVRHHPANLEFLQKQKQNRFFAYRYRKPFSPCIKIFLVVLVVIEGPVLWRWILIYVLYILYQCSNVGDLKDYYTLVY